MYNTQNIYGDSYLKQFFSRNIILVPTIVSAVLAVTYIIDAFTEASALDTEAIQEYLSSYQYLSVIAIIMTILQAIPYVFAFFGFLFVYLGAKNQFDNSNLNRGLHILNIAGIVLIVEAVINTIFLVIIITAFTSIFNDVLSQYNNYTNSYASMEAKSLVAAFEFLIISYTIIFAVVSALYAYASIKTTATIKDSQTNDEYSYRGCTFLFTLSIILTVLFGLSTLSNISGNDFLNLIVAAGCFLFNLFIAIIAKQYKSMVSNINYQKIRAQSIASSPNVYTGYNQTQYNPVQPQFNGYNSSPVVPTPNMYGSYANQSSYSNTPNFQKQYNNQYTPNTSYQNPMNTTAQSFGAFNTSVQGNASAQTSQSLNTEQTSSLDSSSNNITHNTIVENSSSEEDKSEPVQSVQQTQPINGKRCVFCGNICGEAEQFCPVCGCRLV